MGIGSSFPAEVTELTEPRTGRTLRQLTAGAHNNYPLYYFIDSMTPDGRYLIFHSERTGWVQLYRLDWSSGEVVQLTDGRTPDAGWAIWCEHHLRGVYNHLAALNAPRGELYYFQDDEIRCTSVESLSNRAVASMPGRTPVGQTSFSPDGRLFAFVHADRALFASRIGERESLSNMGQFSWERDHGEWRNRTPTTISVMDTTTGALRTVVELDYHVHHILFVDNDRLLLNHVRDDSGMWIINLDGSGVRTLRPRDAHGVTCHQTLTANGIFYEANEHSSGQRVVHVGRYDLGADRFAEYLLPSAGYVHTGRDPAGRFLFCENMDDQVHQLLALRRSTDGAYLETEILRELPAIPFGQRYHAHPFLTPERKWLVYTERVNGFSQVCALDVADLVDQPEYGW